MDDDHGPDARRVGLHLLRGHESYRRDRAGAASGKDRRARRKVHRTARRRAVSAPRDERAGGGLRDVNHPSYQAMTYANLIRDYNESVQLQDINVVPCAYLHNYYFDNDDTLLSNNYKEYTDSAPLFGHNDVLKLR